MIQFNKWMNTDSEYAKVIEWTPKWDAGAPLPQIFSNGLKIFLIYLTDEVIADPNKAYVTIDNVKYISVSSTNEERYPLALVEFSGDTFRFGIAGDEVFSGLSLWGKGLEGYAAHIIENSAWINELKQIHKVHPYYNEERWKDKKHYTLLFHDNILEVIATKYKIETFITTFGQLATEVAKRMNQ